MKLDKGFANESREFYKSPFPVVFQCKVNFKCISTKPSIRNRLSVSISDCLVLFANIIVVDGTASKSSAGIGGSSEIIFIGVNDESPSHDGFRSTQ